MFRGSITALITPFLNGQLDEAAFRKLVDWQIVQGIHGLVPCGTTGESPTVTHAEHARAIQWCIEETRKRVPVIAGTGSNSTAEAIDLSKAAQKMGADGLLIVTPYYNKPTQEGLFQHFKAIHDTTDLPILIYNIPGRSVIDMSLDTMKRLRELPRISGLKDATGDLTRMSLERAALGDDFCLLSGDDGSTLGFLAQGGKGCISVTSNVAPALCAQTFEKFQNGDALGALKLHDQLMPLHHGLFLETSPAPVKYCAEKLGICSGELRLPMVPVSAATATKLDDALKASGLL